MTLRQTLAELVAFDSVSSRTNASVIDYLEARCRAIGFRLQRFPYTDDHGVEKINLLASSSADLSAVELILVGHTDTVPFDPAWTDALTLKESDGKLFGRGACDTKAFITAALTAMQNVDRQSLRRPFALLFTADEEIGLIGAKRFSALKPLKAKFALVGEPTSLQPIRGGKGYCLAEITVGGREAHSAYPALGTSAINGASRLISRIEQIATNMQSEARQDFDPPFTTLNIGLIQGGTAKNVIPGRCSFTLEWRPIPGQDANFLLTKIEAAVAEEAARDPNLTFKIDASRADAGFETSAHSRLVTLMKNLTGRASGTVAFGTEAAQMAELGAEAVVFGPGNIRDAHRTGEFVPVAELERCAEILTAAIDAFCVA